MTARQVVTIGPPVRVPLDLPTVGDPALALWVVIVQQAAGRTWVDRTQDQLQADLGRLGSDPRYVGTLATQLVAAGMLRVERRHVAGKTRNRYFPLLRTLGDGREYVPLPAALLTALAGGEAGPEHIGAAVRWLADIRERGGRYTPLTMREAAEAWGQGERTVRRHRAALVALGVLDERVRPGQSPITAMAGKLAESPAEVSRPRPPIPHHPGHQSHITPATNPTQEKDLKKNHPNEKDLISTPQPRTVGAEGTALTRARPDRAASPRTLPVIDPSGWGTLAELPRPWRDAPTWVQRLVAARIGEATATVTHTTVEHDEQGRMCVDQRVRTFPLGQKAILRAARIHAPKGPTAGHHLATLTTVITNLSRDVQLGTCPACGDAGDPTGPLTLGYCPSCDPTPWHDSGGVCASCEGPRATPRAELPLRSSVCDGCWPDIAATLSESDTLERTVA